MENRKVVTLDIPGAFMQANIDELITYVKLTDKLVDLLVLVDLSYAQFVTYKKARKYYTLSFVGNQLRCYQ